MTDFQKEIPPVTNEMILATIKGDWEEYYNELEMDALATSKRIIEELGSYFYNPEMKLITLICLQKLVNKNAPNDTEANNFLKNKLIYALKGFDLTFLRDHANILSNINI